MHKITCWLAKNKTRLFVIAPSTTLAFITIVLALSGCSSAAVSTVAATPLEAKPNFVIGGLGVSPSVINPGEEVTVYANLTNSGNSGGDYLANLEINGITSEVRKVTLGPGASQDILFKLSRDIPQVYNIGMGGLTVQFVVSEKQQTGYGLTATANASADVTSGTAGNASCCSPSGSGASNATSAASGGASCCGGSSAPLSTSQPGASVPVQRRSCCGQ